MIQEMFKGRVTPVAAGGFVGLLSLFNMVGRFIWSSLSDAIGRKPTYMVFFSLGAILYLVLSWSGQSGLNNLTIFVLSSGLIISMYGGGFATIPAYLRDMFGTINVSAIHGRLLTAWSVAGVAGPLLVNYLRQYQLDHGVAPANVYSLSHYIMAGLLVIGFFCNLLVRPVNPKYFGAKSAGFRSRWFFLSRRHRLQRSLHKPIAPARPSGAWRCAIADCSSARFHRR
jgi:MFS family permease